jgi:hypothetical protein
LDNSENRYLPIGERIAILETKYGALDETLKNVEEKLDQLLELKSKGIGAFWLVGLLLGSGLLGIVSVIFGVFNQRPHL